jgi:hypothetical protein
MRFQVSEPGHDANIFPARCPAIALVWNIIFSLRSPLRLYKFIAVLLTHNQMALRHPRYFVATVASVAIEREHENRWEFGAF